jgi:hypothetical protein
VRRQRFGPSGPNRFLQSSQAQVQHPLTPLTDRHMAGAQFSGDLIVILAFGG